MQYVGYSSPALAGIILSVEESANRLELGWWVADEAVMVKCLSLRERDAVSVGLRWSSSVTLSLPPIIGLPGWACLYVSERGDYLAILADGGLGESCW